MPKLETWICTTLGDSTDAHAEFFLPDDSDDKHLSHCSLYIHANQLQASWFSDLLPTHVAAWGVPPDLWRFQTVTVCCTPTTQHNWLISICHQVQCLPFRMLNQAMTLWSLRHIHQTSGRALFRSFFIRRRRCKVEVIIWRITLSIINWKWGYGTTLKFDIFIFWNNNRCSIGNLSRYHFWSRLTSALTNQVPGSAGSSITGTLNLNEATTPCVVRLKAAITDCPQHVRHLLQRKSETVPWIYDDTFQVGNVTTQNHSISPFDAKFGTVRKHTCFAAVRGYPSGFQAVTTRLQKLTDPKLHLSCAQRTWCRCSADVGSRHDRWWSHH